MSASRPLPSLTALRAFDAAARLRSVSRAAEALHVTHGAISRQLRLLEDEIGVTLFARDGRGIRPTAAGQRLLEATGSAFGLLQARIAELRRDSGPETLVLACPGSILARWVIPRLPQLQQQLPQLRVHLSPQDGDFPPGLEGLDAALLLGQAPWPADWSVEVLAPERIGPVLSPALAQARGWHEDPPPAAVLDGEVLHTHSRPQAWPTWLASQQLPAAQLRLGTGFAHLYYLLEAAVAGVGVAIAPEPLVADELRSGRLVAPWGFVQTDGHWALCTPAGRGDARTAALADWLRSQLA